MNKIYPNCYDQRIWQISSLEGCIGYKKGFAEYAIVDGDGGIIIASCPCKKYAEIIAKKLNGEFRYSK